VPGSPVPRNQGVDRPRLPTLGSQGLGSDGSSRQHERDVLCSSRKATSGTFWRTGSSIRSNRKAARFALRCRPAPPPPSLQPSQPKKQAPCAEGGRGERGPTLLRRRARQPCRHGCISRRRRPREMKSRLATVQPQVAGVQRRGSRTGPTERDREPGRKGGATGKPSRTDRASQARTAAPLTAGVVIQRAR